MSLFRYLWHQVKRFFGLVPAPVPPEPVVQPPLPPQFPFPLVGPEYKSGTVVIQDGQYVSTRDGVPQQRADGAWDLMTLDEGDRFPAVMQSGDRWRKVVDPACRPWHAP